MQATAGVQPAAIARLDRQLPDDDELAMLNSRFEKQTPSEIVAWAVNTFHPHLSVATSMTDAVLIDIAVQIEPAIEAVFIDTGYHFPETLDTVESVRLALSGLLEQLALGEG